MGEGCCCPLCGGDIAHRKTIIVRGVQTSEFHCADCGARIIAEALI